MKKKFLTNILLLLVLNLLVKPFWILGIDLSVQNTVGTEAYGFYFSLFSFSLLLNIILDLGLTNYNTRVIARDPELLDRQFSSIFGLRFLLAIFYAGISLGVAAWLGYDRQQFSMLYILIFNQFLASFTLYFRSNLSGLHLFRTDSLLSVTDRVVMIAVCGILLWGNVTEQAFRIEWFVYAQSFSYLVSFGLSFFLVLRRTSRFRPVFRPREWRRLLGQSLPFAMLILLMTLYYRVDSVMLERMLPDGKVQAGIYAQAFRLLDTLGMFAFLFATLLLPIFSRMIRKGEAIDGMLSFAFNLLMVPSLVLSASLVFYREAVMGLLYRGEGHSSPLILALLMVAYLGMAASYIFGTLLTAGGHLKAMNTVALGSLVGNVVLNLFLIPGYGAKGAALASMITQLAAAGLQVFLVARLYPMPSFRPYAWRWIVFTAGVPGLDLALSGWLSSTWAGFFLSLLLPAALALLIRLLRPGEWLSWMRQQAVEDTPGMQEPSGF